MRITQWDPFRELAEFERTVGRMFGRRSHRGTYGYPPIDLIDIGEAFVLSAFLPGIKLDQINLSVFERTVSLKGSREPRIVQNAKPLLRERRYGPFEKHIELPEPIYEGDVKAQYTNGVLRVTLPKRRSLQPKTIVIE